jgi:transposase
VRVGMEATGHSRWFERWLTELNYELWVGNPAEIRVKRCASGRTIAWMLSTS